MDELEEQLLREILSFYRGKRHELIPILLEIQANFGYLPEDAIELISSFLDMAEGEVYSVASFYAQFRLVPLGKRRVTVCRGTACHIRGSSQILREVEKAVGVKEGETSSDMEYSVETVACIGCCALAPCLRIDNDVRGEMTVEKVRGLLSSNRGVGD